MAHRRWIVGPLLALVVVAAGVALATPANAALPRQVVRTGTCSATSTWKLTLTADHGRIEADMEVQSPKAGETWRSVFRDNGSVFARARSTTLADASFSVTRFAANATGTDHIRVASTDLTTGERCIATAAF